MPLAYLKALWNSPGTYGDALRTNQPRLCTDCRWHGVEQWTQTQFHYCTGWIEPVIGTRPRHSCDWQRSNDGYCKYQAKLFEPKEKK